MPRIERRRRETQWVPCYFGVNNNVRFAWIDSRAPVNFATKGSSAAFAVANREVTILASHAYFGFQQTIPGDGEGPDYAEIGIGVATNGASRLTTAPEVFFGVGFAVPTAGTTTQTAWSCVINSRAKRRWRPGDCLVWDTIANPVALWATNKIIVVGIGRILVAL